MTQIISYLSFSGNCREAMIFYQKCLGGKLTLQTIGDSPMADKMPPKMKEKILHATLVKGNMTLLGSDMVGEKGLVKGNAVSMMLHCSSEAEIKARYASLSADGEATHPLENTFWGALLGDLTDKFGNHWLLHFEQPKTSSNELPIKLSAPAKRALEAAGINILTDFAKFTEAEIAELHGIGKNALTAIKEVLKEKAIPFKGASKN